MSEQSPPGVLASSIANMTSQKRPAQADSFAPADAFDFDFGTSPPPSKKTRLENENAKTKTKDDELDEGEIRGPPSINTAPDGSDMKVRKSSQQIGWNTGVTGTLRTSFTSKSAIDPPALGQLKGSDALDTGLGPSDSASVDHDTPKTGGQRTQYSKTVIPSLDSTLLPTPGASDMDPAYSEWFVTWLMAALPLNRDKPAFFDKAHLPTAYNKWLASQEVNGKKRKLFGVGAMRIMKQGAFEETMEAIQNKGMSADRLRQFIQPAPAEYKLPPKTNVEKLNLSPNDQRGWDILFDSWCRDFLKLNIVFWGAEGLRSPVLESYKLWLKGSVKAVQRSAWRRAHTTADENRLRAILDKVRADKSAPAEHTGTTGAEPSANSDLSTGSVPTVGKREHESTTITLGLETIPAHGDMSSLNGRVPAPEIQREAPDAATEDMPSQAALLYYFPGVSANDIFCTLCASRQHRSGTCPALNCSHCHGEHPSYSCSSRLRCAKCRQLGHSKQACQEKLIMPSDQAVCAICGSKEHTETLCDEAWRSFDPWAGPTRKVNQLPIFCYFCGTEGHYGADCGLSGPAHTLSRRETWCKTAIELYQDSDVSNLAVLANNAGAGAFGSTQAADARPNFGGRSIVPQTHVYFESDDDDENEGFLHAPVQKRSKPSRINFSSQRAGRSSGTRNAPPPPLPPGPPPPLPGAQSTRRSANKQPSSGGKRGRGRGRGKN